MIKLVCELSSTMQRNKLDNDDGFDVVASGVSVGEWQSTGSSYRASSGSYAQVGSDSSRQYGSSTSVPGGHAYFGASGSSQSYNKWY